MHLLITAETRCQVWLNGHEVGRAPKPGQPWLQYYHRFAVNDFLHTGENVLAVLVYYQGYKRDDVPAGLLVEFEAQSQNPAGQKLPASAADGNWRVTRCHAWSEKTESFDMNFFYPYQEHFDCRKFPEGWFEPDFDDAQWQGAIKAGEQRALRSANGTWSRLVENPLPPMTDQPVWPVEVMADECVYLPTRQRGPDLSISLSQAGQEPRHCRVDNLEILTHQEPEEPATLQGTHPLPGEVHDGMWDPCLTVDFGSVITAYPELTIEAPAGVMVQVGYAERLINGHFNNAIECWFADSFSLKEGRQILRPFTWKAFRYLRLRFIWHKGQPIKLHALRACVSTYPFQPRGNFTSPDEELSGIWGISRYTLRLCSNEFLMDTPFREAAQWLGDVASVTLGGIYSCFGDARLSREFYRQTAANQFCTGMISNISNMPSSWMNGTIPDYSLEWLIFLWDFYLYTGDTQFLEEIYPQAQRLIHAHLPHLNDRGFIEDMPHWVLIDWAHTDRRGECTAYNALFYAALLSLSNIARQLEDPRMARHCDHLGEVIAANFQQHFFCEERGCFADARVDGQLSEMHSEHASLAAIRFGLADEHVTARILKRFYETPREKGKLPYTAECEPFFTTFVLQALHQVGRMDLALRVIRDRWGRRMLDKGCTSVLEEWSDSGSWRQGDFIGLMRTHSHAWSAAPADFLIRNLMGLDILEPGCRKIRLDPARTEFAWTARFPLPTEELGEVEVTWDGQNFQITDLEQLRARGVEVSRPESVPSAGSETV